MRWWHLGNLVVVPMLIAGLPGQQTFRTQSRVVPIYASVRGADGRLTTGLTRDDFQIFDNGQQRPVSVFSAESVPLSVVALFQVGHRPESVVSRRAEPTRAAGAALVASLGEIDVLQIGSYGSEAVLNPIVTGDRATLTRILDEEIWNAAPDRCC